MKDRGNRLLCRGANAEAAAVYTEALTTLDNFLAEQAENDVDDSDDDDDDKAASHHDDDDDDHSQHLRGSLQAEGGGHGKARSRKVAKGAHSQIRRAAPSLDAHLSPPSATVAAMMSAIQQDTDLRALRVAVHCNRSLVRLRQGEPAAALSDACYALSADGASSKAFLRRAEAALNLGLFEHAESDLSRAEGGGAGALGAAECGPGPGVGGDAALRKRIADGLAAATSHKPLVSATPSDLAAHLRAARPGTTIRLAAGVYMGPFRIDQDIRLIGPGPGDGEAVFDTVDSSAATLDICAPGRVVLSGLIVRHGDVAGQKALSTVALYVTSGELVVHRCAFSRAAGPSVGNLQLSRMLLWACAIHDGAAGGLLLAGGQVHGLEIRVWGNAALGVEVRQGGELVLERSRVWGNGRQGLVLWCDGRRAEIRDCEFFKNR
jgi:hypothetical protein